MLPVTEQDAKPHAATTLYQQTLEHYLRSRLPTVSVPQKRREVCRNLQEKHLDDHFIFTNHLLITSFLVFKASFLPEVDSTVWVNIKK